jgi:hypothetical protein
MVWPVKLALQYIHSRVYTFSVTLRVENWRAHRIVHVASCSKPRKPVARRLRHRIDSSNIFTAADFRWKVWYEWYPTCQKSVVSPSFGGLINPSQKNYIFTNAAVRSSLCKCCFGIKRCLGTWPGSAHSPTSFFHLGGFSDRRKRRVKRLTNVLRVQTLFSCKITETLLSLYRKTVVFHFSCH